MIAILVLLLVSAAIAYLGVFLGRMSESVV
jgi:hypothetical protein